MATDAPVTYRALVTAFTDFLTVAIHTILYERHIYPQTSFLSARRYNLAVRQSRHPKVCEWIIDAVTAVEVQLLKGAVDRVAVVIYNKSNVALERFMFDVSPFPSIAETDVDIPLIRDDQDEVQNMPLADMDEQFRAVMTRLTNCASSLKPVPQGCTFTIAIELKNEDHHAPVSHPQAWIPVEARPQTDSSGEPAKTPKATPIRAMVAGELAFDAWVEESKAKLTADPTSNTSSGSSKS